MDAKDHVYRDGFWHEELQKGRLKANKRRVSPSEHFLAHLYARRCEECYEQFRERFDPDGSSPLVTEIATDVLDSYTPLRGEKLQRSGDKLSWSVLKAGTPVREWLILLGATPAGSLTLLGGPAKYADLRCLRPIGGAMFFSLYGKEDSPSKEFQTDPFYHQYVYHNTAEMLVHDYVIQGEEYHSIRNTKGLRNPYLDFPDWFHEAWARVQEMDRFGQALVHCMAETVNTDFRPGKRSEYIEMLKKWEGQKKLVPFPEIARASRDRFNAKIHIQIWFIADYLRRRDPLAFHRLVARTKILACELNDEKEGFTRALDEVYGLTPLGLEDAWRADLLKQR